MPLIIFLLGSRALRLSSVVSILWILSTSRSLLKLRFLSYYLRDYWKKIKLSQWFRKMSATQFYACFQSNGYNHQSKYGVSFIFNKRMVWIGWTDQKTNWHLFLTDFKSIYFLPSFKICLSYIAYSMLYSWPSLNSLELCNPFTWCFI